MANYWRNLLAALAFAVSSHAHAVDSSEGAIARIYPSGDGTINFRLVGDQCNTSTEYYYFAPDHPSAKSWYAILLLAAATGKSVIVSVADCAPGNKSIRYLLIDS